MNTNNAHLINLAKMKAEHLQKNTRIRLTAEPQSLYVFNLNGVHYCGYFVAEPAPLLFKNQPEFIMQDAAGRTEAVLQRLK